MELHDCSLAHGDNRDRRCAWCGAKLTGRQRRWCSERHSYAWRINHCWTDARAAALDRDGHKCVVCGDPFTLEVHHDPPVQKGYVTGCHHHLDKLKTLCRVHHLEAHRLLRAEGRDLDVQLTLV